jgi:peptide/nickel transport system substrate-binding protein
MIHAPGVRENAPKSPGRKSGVALFGAFVTAAAMIVSGCAGSSGGSGPDAAAAGTPKTGGSFTVELASSPDGLDPGAVGTHAAEEVTNQMYADLVSQSPKGAYVPWLATSWSSNSNASVWTLNLRHGVKFQDGTPFNAAAVCFNFDRAVSPAEKSKGAGILLAPMKSCKAVSTYQVKVTFTQGYEPFLNAMTTPLLGMVSPTAVRKQGANFNLNPVGGGSGPFEFVKWVQNDQIQLKRWPGYKTPPAGAKHTGPAYLSNITFKIVPETSVRVGAVVSKQFDAAETILPAEYASLKANSAVHVYDVNEAASTYQMAFNTSKAPWNSLKMRQAVRSAINVPQLLHAIYFGVEQQAWSSIAPNVQYYDSSLEHSWKNDAAKAGQLLDSLGWKMGSGGYREKGGQTLTMQDIDTTPDSNSNQQVDVFLKQQLKSVGIKVVTSDMTQAQEITAVQAGNYDIVGTSLGLSSPNVMNFLFNSAFIPSAKSFGFNWAQVNSPQLDAMLARGQTTTDQTQLQSIYSRAQQMVASNVWTIPLYVTAYTFVAGSNVHGISFEFAAYPDFYATWLS